MFNIYESNSLEKIWWLGTQLQARQYFLGQLASYYEGNQPSTFLPPELLAQLGNRMINLNINYCRKSITALTDRLNLTGFRVDGSDSADPDLWQTYNRNSMQVRSSWALNDALSLGSGYVSVWVGGICQGG